MLYWVIMSSNCAPFYGEVDACLLVNGQGDEPPHLTQVTRRPQDGKGYWSFTKLFDLVHG